MTDMNYSDNYDPAYPADLLTSACKERNQITCAGAGGRGKTLLCGGMLAYVGSQMLSGTMKGPWELLIHAPHTSVLADCVPAALRLLADQEVLETLVESTARDAVRSGLKSLGNKLSSANEDITESIMIQCSQSNRSGELERDLKRSLALYGKGSIITLENLHSVIGDRFKDAASDVYEIAKELADLALVPLVWTALWPSLIKDHDLMLKLSVMFGAIGSLYGHIFSVQNEYTDFNTGVIFQLSRPKDNKYVAYWPKIVRKGHRVERVQTTLFIRPEDLILGLMMFGVVRVGTLNSHFASEYDFANTLKGGLDEGTVYVLQMLNDLAATIGGVLLIEMRDDFEVSTTINSEYDVTAEELSSASRRLMSSSHCAIYLHDKGHMYCRFRSYGQGQFAGEYSSVYFKPDDIPGVSLENGVPKINWPVQNMGLSPYELAFKHTRRV